MAISAASVHSAPAPAQPAAARVQTEIEALSRDAAVYADRYGVPHGEALRRLRLQQASVVAVDALAAAHADRLAGVFFEHVPDYRLIVLLTGTDPVAGGQIAVAGLQLPVEYRTGGFARRADVLAVLATRAADLRAALRDPPAMGADARSGMLVVVARASEIASEGAGPMAARLAAIAGVPVQVRSAGGTDSNNALEGGARLIGTEGGRRFLCTSGFVVGDGVRRGIVTAAHCPDRIDLHAVDGTVTRLDMVEAWGARYQDVQVHVATTPDTSPPAPLFRADSETQPRRLTSWRNRASTRVGDFVCHRGERTGYSCAEVEFTDYAPPGTLCAGPCDPTWVAVKGPGCRGGDSGGPVFSGSVAFGILKGSSYTAGRVCQRYYYMSVDHLPPGWTLTH